MKVKVISSWNDPIIGKTYPNDSIIEIDAINFNSRFHEEIKPKKKTKKAK